jgi:Bifunctional DNA primase/polymerase, N-terminal
VAWRRAIAVLWLARGCARHTLRRGSASVGRPFCRTGNPTSIQAARPCRARQGFWFALFGLVSGHPMKASPECFNTYAAALVENGFTVTPTRGKDAFLRHWQHPKPTDRVWLGKMMKANRYAGCNIGIVCGRVVAIDIDANDPAQVEKIETMLERTAGATPFQRVGRAPRTLHLYRPTEGEVIPSSKFACVEVLSGGRQFVAFGIHPNTGKLYQWIDPSPATARIEELPIITTAAVQEFTDAVCTALGSPQRGVPVPSLKTVDAARKTRQQTRQGEMLGSVYDARIVRDADGRVIDGREARLAVPWVAHINHLPHEQIRSS